MSLMFDSTQKEMSYAMGTTNGDRVCCGGT
jgi:hypothetical protein